MAEQFWKDQNIPQRIVLVLAATLLVTLLVIQIFYPGVFSTNIR